MELFVAELIQPGTWLDGFEGEERRDVAMLLFWTTSCLSDAALSLSMFVASREQPPESEALRRQALEDQEERRQIRNRVEGEIGSLPHCEDWSEWLQEVEYRAEVEFNRARWARGKPPDEYLHRLPFVHARSFVTALDGVQKGLRGLAEIEPVSENLQDILDRLEQDVPALTDLRNSIQHGEDRLRRKGPGGKDIEPEPIETPEIRTAGGAVVYDNLSGHRYGCTLADGTFAEVDVTSGTLLRVRDAVQEAMDDFQWSGPRQMLPR